MEVPTIVKDICRVLYYKVSGWWVWSFDGWVWSV